jgi:hypothetical protein
MTHDELIEVVGNLLHRVAVLEHTQKVLASVSQPVEGLNTRPQLERAGNAAAQLGASRPGDKFAAGLGADDAK